MDLKDFEEGRDLAVEDVLARQYYSYDASVPLSISGDLEVLGSETALLVVQMQHQTVFPSVLVLDLVPLLSRNLWI